MKLLKNDLRSSEKNSGEQSSLSPVEQLPKRQLRYPIQLDNSTSNSSNMITPFYSSQLTQDTARTKDSNAFNSQLNNNINTSNINPLFITPRSNTINYKYTSFTTSIAKNLQNQSKKSLAAATSDDVPQKPKTNIRQNPRILLQASPTKQQTFSCTASTIFGNQHEGSQYLASPSSQQQSPIQQKENQQPHLVDIISIQKIPQKKQAKAHPESSKKAQIKGEASESSKMIQTTLFNSNEKIMNKQPEIIPNKKELPKQQQSKRKRHPPSTASSSTSNKLSRFLPLTSPKDQVVEYFLSTKMTPTLPSFDDYIITFSSEYRRKTNSTVQRASYQKNRSSTKRFAESSPLRLLTEDQQQAQEKQRQSTSDCTAPRSSTQKRERAKIPTLLSHNVRTSLFFQDSDSYLAEIERSVEKSILNPKRSSTAQTPKRRYLQQPTQNIAVDIPGDHYPTFCQSDYDYSKVSYLSSETSNIEKTAVNQTGPAYI